MKKIQKKIRQKMKNRLERKEQQDPGACEKAMTKMIFNS